MKNDIKKLYDTAYNKCKTKDVGEIMCKKLKELNGKSPEYFLNATKQTGNVVVDIKHIVQNAGILLFSRTFQDIEDVEKQEVAGLVLANGDNVGIFYDVDASEERQRFIIAHELGHCCLHEETLKAGYVEFLHKNGFENERESVASMFAAKLLIQKVPLQKIYNQLLCPTLSVLADIFKVPEHLIEFRLKDLGLKYYEKVGDRFVEAK